MKAEEFGLKSIAFPAIGTGGFSFPHTAVSKLMFDEVFKFSRCQSRKTLQEVHFVLHPNDRQNIQVFFLRAKPSMSHAVRIKVHQHVSDTLLS